MFQMDQHVLFKRPLPVSSSPNKRRSDGSQKRARCSAESSSCLVCTDKANIINYGALSCQSCKTFFRRNGLHPQNTQPCVYNSSCEVNTETRRHCTACRLAKCFAVRMSSDFIRKEEQKTTKHTSSSRSTSNKLVKYNRTMSTMESRTRDDSAHNRSVLTDYEQKVISNVTHALETYSAIPNVCVILEEDLSIILESPFEETSMVEFFNCIYRSMASFIKSTPDFQILTTDEQCSLFQRNLDVMVNLYSAVVFRDTNMINNTHYTQSFASIYGGEMMEELIRICKQLDSDSTIISLMLLILAFSSNCSMITGQEEIYADTFLLGTYRLFGSQSVYVEVLWKYMDSRYGHYESALRFTQLIKISLDLIKYSANAYMNNSMYFHLVNDFNQGVKQLLIVDQNKELPLWGRYNI